jgi:hypothetical protein
MISGYYTFFRLFIGEKKEVFTRQKPERKSSGGSPNKKRRGYNTGETIGGYSPSIE